VSLSKNYFKNTLQMKQQNKIWWTPTGKCYDDATKRCAFTWRLKVPSVSDAVTLDGKVFQTAEKDAFSRDAWRCRVSQTQWCWMAKCSKQQKKMRFHAMLEGAECLRRSDAGWQSVPNSRKRCVFTRRLKVPSVSDAVTLDGKVFQTTEKATQTRMLVTNVSIPNVTVSRSRAFSTVAVRSMYVNRY